MPLAIHVKNTNHLLKGRRSISCTIYAPSRLFLRHYFNAIFKRTHICGAHCSLLHEVTDERTHKTMQSARTHAPRYLLSSSSWESTQFNIEFDTHLSLGSWRGSPKVNILSLVDIGLYNFVQHRTVRNFIKRGNVEIIGPIYHSLPLHIRIY